MIKSLKATIPILLVVMLIGLIGCQPPAPTATTAAGETSGTGDVTTISFWHGWAVEHEKAAMDEAVKLFNDTHPNIKVEAVAGKTNDQVLTAVSGGNPPDVWSLWSTMTLAEWASKDVILDLSDRIAADNIDLNLFYKGALEVSTYQGKNYGLPVEVDPLVVYYNKTLFKEAGLDPEKPPATMEELYAFAEMMTISDDAGNITQLGFQGNVYNEAYLYGGNWWDPATGQPTATDPGNIAAWTAIQNYYQKFGGEKLNTYAIQQIDNPLGSLFMAGKAAMAIDGDWVVNFMTRFAPEIDYGIFPIPPAEGHSDRANSFYLDGSIYVIPSNAANPDAAWEFVSWMATTPEASGILQKAWANTSPLKAVVTDPKYAPNDRWDSFTELMEKGQAFIWPPIAVSSMYHDDMLAASDAVKFGQITPEDALTELQEKITNELKMQGQ